MYFLWFFPSKDNFVPSGCDDVNLVTFSYELLTGDSFRDLLYCGKKLSGGNNEIFNEALKVVDFSVFSKFLDIESYHPALIGPFKTPPMKSGVGGLFERIISLFPFFSCV